MLLGDILFTNYNKISFRFKYRLNSDMSGDFYIQYSLYYSHRLEVHVIHIIQHVLCIRDTSAVG
jgi:hypothetical protein